MQTGFWGSARRSRTGACKPEPAVSTEFRGGACRDRTGDLRLAKWEQAGLGGTHRHERTAAGARSPRDVLAEIRRQLARQEEEEIAATRERLEQLGAAL